MRLDVGLVHQSGCLEGVLSAFLAQIRRGDSIQLAVDQGNKLIQSLAIAIDPAAKVVCNLFGHENRATPGPRLAFGTTSPAF